MIRYADDIMIWEENEEELTNQIVKWKDAIETAEEVAYDKNKGMKISSSGKVISAVSMKE